MLTLSSRELMVELLDPADAGDRAHQGSRFCWGGYVWQVTDPVAGNLLAGPDWPAANPRAFNGQGLPESFRHSSFPDQRPLTTVGGRGFVIGAGDVGPGADGQPAVGNPCRWDVTRSDRSLKFEARQSSQGWETDLVRVISIAGRTLTSLSRLTNRGNRPLPLHWFAHPFFALGGGMLTCDLPEGYSFDENPGFALSPSGRLSFKRPFHGVDDGQFQLLKIPAHVPLSVSVSHPRLAFVRFAADFTPDVCPVWGNGNTWSIEPYIVTTLAPGESRTWKLTYEFGPVSA